MFYGMGKKYRIALEESEVKLLKKIINSGQHSARKITRARVLLMANEKDLSKRDKEICEALGLSRTTPGEIRKRYIYRGLERTLKDAARPGQKRKLTARQEAEVIAIACSNPRDGYERWTLNLLTEEVQKKVNKTVGRTAVYKVLLRNELKPWLKKNVVHTKDNRRIQRKNDGCVGGL